MDERAWTGCGHKQVSACVCVGLGCGWLRGSTAALPGCQTGRRARARAHTYATVNCTPSVDYGRLDCHMHVLQLNCASATPLYLQCLQYVGVYAPYRAGQHHMGFHRCSGTILAPRGACTGPPAAPCPCLRRRTRHKLIGNGSTADRTSMGCRALAKECVVRLFHGSQRPLEGSSV